MGESVGQSAYLQSPDFNMKGLSTCNAYISLYCIYSCTGAWWLTLELSRSYCFLYSRRGLDSPNISPLEKVHHVTDFFNARKAVGQLPFI